MTDFGFQLGPLEIRWYALIILTGSLIALWLATREAKRFGGTADEMYDLFFIIMFAGIIGARIYYVIFSPAQFVANPLSIFKIWEGGIAIYGGIIGGGLGALFYAKRHHLNIPLLADILLPVVMLAQSIGRWGNFVNIEAYGGIVPGMNLTEQIGYLKQLFIPDFIIQRMIINGNVHHPTFLYESLWNFCGFILIYFIVRNYKKLYTGMISCTYAIWYGIGRFFIEGMRTDSLYLFGGTSGPRVSQIVSLVIICVGILGLIYIYLHRDKGTLYREDKLHLVEK